MAALEGKIIDPRKFGKMPKFEMPKKFLVNDNMIIPPLPPDKAKNVEIVRGPNIKPLPEFNPLPQKLEGEVLLKVEDNITTDHIMPAGANILPLRSNIPEISKFVFNVIDSSFPKRSQDKGGGFVIGGDNYGQGSSREHAAIAPKYLGVKAIIVKSFARIHLANLVNFGIVPLTLVHKEDYSKIEKGDRIEIDLSMLETKKVMLKNLTKNLTIELTHTLSSKDVEELKAGGKLTLIKQKFAH
jgi:aconitate hydratase